MKDLIESSPTLKIAKVGVSAPRPPEPNDPGAERWYDAEGTLCIIGHITSEAHWMHVFGIASYRFTARGSCVWAVPEADASEAEVTDVFYRCILPITLHLRGQAALHASAVETPAGVLGLCASSTTGKSTLARALELRGYPLWTDDVLAFKVYDSKARALPLPFILRLRRASAEYFGERAKFVPEPNYWRRLPQREPRSLAALCLLERFSSEEAEPVVCERRRPSSAFNDVMSHIYHFTLKDPASRRAIMEQVLELVAHVPIFRVRFRVGFEHLPQIVAGLEREVLTVEPPDVHR